MKFPEKFSRYTRSLWNGIEFNFTFSQNKICSNRHRFCCIASEDDDVSTIVVNFAGVVGDDDISPSQEIFMMFLQTQETMMMTP